MTLGYGELALRASSLSAAPVFAKTPLKALRGCGTVIRSQRVVASRVAFPAIRRSAFGFLSGVGVLFLYVAWVQRAGPGTTCWHTATASGCSHHLNPLAWLLLGIGMVITGIVGYASRA